MDLEKLANRFSRVCKDGEGFENLAFLFCGDVGLEGHRAFVFAGLGGVFRLLIEVILDAKRFFPFFPDETLRRSIR